MGTRAGTPFHLATGDCFEVELNDDGLKAGRRPDEGGSMTPLLADITITGPLAAVILVVCGYVFFTSDEHSPWPIVAAVVAIALVFGSSH